MKAFHEVRQYDDDFMVWHSAYDNMSFWAHWHEEMELILIRSGTAHIQINHHTITGRQGDLIICDSGDIHYSDSYQMANRLEFIVFDPHLISSHYQYTGLASPLLKADELKAAGLDRLTQRLFSQIPQELHDKRPFYQELVKSLLREFWYTVRRFLQETDRISDQDARHYYMLSKLQRLLNYIDQHYEESLPLSWAADWMGFSESYLSRLFKQYTGVHYVSYLQMVRVEQAIQLLHDPSRRMVDIAYDCGFANIRTFNRVFKQLTSYSPVDFRSQKNFEEYTFSLGTRRASQEERVENDSIVVMNNSKRLWENQLASGSTDK